MAARLSAELAKLEDRCAVLQLRRDSLAAKAGELAEEVAELKNCLSERFSPLDEMRLGERLRRSQVLADSLDAVNMAILELETKISRCRRLAIGAYTRAIDSLRLKLDEAFERRAGEKIIRQIELARSRRAALAGDAENAADAEGGSQLLSLGKLLEAVRITPGDTPEEIREKADFLQDVADKWLRTLSMLERSLERISEESAIRKRLSEFAQELSLFDETTLPGRAQQRAPAGSGNNGISNQEVEKGFSSTTALNPRMAAEPAPTYDLELYDPEGDLWLLQNLENLSPEDLEAAFGRLEARRDSLKSELDSLRAVEQGFRKTADEIEREKENTPPK